MEIVILTGMSGAGKSLAAIYLEDMGFFCIDNLPPDLVPDLVNSFARSSMGRATDIDTKRMAFVIDVRGLDLFDGIIPALDRLSDMKVDYRIIFLDATDQTLLSRYKQSRRNHPLAQGRGIVKAIELERQRLAPIKNLAADVIDTSNLTPGDFRNILYAMLSLSDRDERMTILIQSFGFKYGIPVDCDNVIDVRFIPNPFYIENLKTMSGLDDAVRDYVMGFDETRIFMEMQEKVMEFAIPFYIREGKVRLTIGVGCTGGRHRSVVLAEDLANRLRDNHLRVVVDHRDIDKDPQKPRSSEQAQHAD
ncbi:MAG TPA: RNase adapter RapZ [Clostridiales bacterium]|nr:RNase adapter RapZ [Clostridiales bacterium]